MPCGKKFGKILKKVRKEYGKKKALKIAWAIYNKTKKKKKKK